MTVKVAIAISKKNGNTLWQDVIQKEMKNVKVAFQIIPKGEKPPNGFQHVNCHMVFDIKMEDFHRKACLVMGGHVTHTLDVIMYSSVVPRETVCIAFRMTMLHDLDVTSADVLNAYVMTPKREKIWTVLSPEFGDDAVKSAVMVRALYCLKKAGASFRAHLAQCMLELG